MLFLRLGRSTGGFLTVETQCKKFLGVGHSTGGFFVFRAQCRVVFWLEVSVQDDFLGLGCS